MTIQDIWTDILHKLETLSKVSTVAYQIYLEKAIPYAEKGKTLVLAVPLASHKRELDNRYRPFILEAMAECNCPYDNFEIILLSETDQYSRENIPTAGQQKEQFGLPFNKEYTFDNFVIGDSNRIASAAALAVAESPGQFYNPMFLYSRPGLGKTHLLNAIGNYLYEHHPEYKVIYITAENFTNDYIFSIRNNKNADAMQNFNNKYRSVDVLMIDDIQFFEKAEKTQEALFHIFNDLYSNNKQIILSSDRPIRHLTFLDERLASRFAAGISVDINTPSLEDRIAILQKKAYNMRMNVSAEVLYYLAEAERNNIRILEGMLKTVSLYAMLNKTEALSVDFAKEALRDSVLGTEDTITIQSIVNVCCNYFHINAEDITGKRRNKEFVVPRQYAMYIITLLMPSTPLTTIGDYFGRDHSTVISARDKIGRLAQTDEETKRVVEDLKNLVLNK